MSSPFLSPRAYAKNDEGRAALMRDLGEHLRTAPIGARRQVSPLKVERAEVAGQLDLFGEPT